MQLKTILCEYLEDRERPASRYDFLPGFRQEKSLPIMPVEVPWSRTDESERNVRFDRRSDLQDFVNCYIELEEETGIYASLTIDRLSIKISSELPLDPRFKSMIDEIAHETRGH